MGWFVFVLAQISGTVCLVWYQGPQDYNKKDTIELDARAIVDAINHQSNANSIISWIMDDGRQLVIQIFPSSLRHVFRKANRSADCLASLGPNLEYDFVLFSSLLGDLISILEADYRVMYFIRPCPELVFAL